MAIIAQQPFFEQRILTRSQANRPELPMASPSYVTVHEVGNMSPGADEEMHVQFVHNGGGQYGVSFHFVVGPTKVSQILYINENAWHASDYYGGTGNRDSLAIETIQIGDFNKTLNHLAWLIAELYTNPARFAKRADYGFADDLHPSMIQERTTTHNFWAPDNKWCPSKILSGGLFLSLVQAAQRHATVIVPDAERFVAAVKPSWWNDETINNGQDQRTSNGSGGWITWHYVDRVYTTLREVRCRAWASIDAPETRTPMPAGQPIRGKYRLKAGDGRWWVVTKYGSRILASHLDPYIKVG